MADEPCMELGPGTAAAFANSGLAGFGSTDSSLAAVFSTFAPPVKGAVMATVSGLIFLAGREGAGFLGVGRCSLLILFTLERGTALSENREGNLRFRVGLEAAVLFESCSLSLSSTSMTSESGDLAL